MQVNFFYQNNQHNYKKEIIIFELCKVISTFLELPPTLDVCLYKLNTSYGGIDLLHINRIGIDYDIDYNQLPMILIHELIHVNQRKTGKLKITPTGKYYWNGVYYTNVNPENMTYQEYSTLPWEIDVSQRQQQIFEEASRLIHSQVDKK